MKGCLRKMEYKTLIKETKYKTLKSKEVIYGKENGYYFVTEPSSLIGLCKVYINVDKEDEVKEIIESMRSTHPEIVIGAFRSKGRYGNFIELNTLEIKNGAQFDNTIKDITLRLKEIGCLQVSESSGHTNGLGIYILGNDCTIMDEQDFHYVLNNEGQRRKKLNDNPVLAYILAVLGGVLGSLLVNIIPIRFFVIYILIPFGVFKGFELKASYPSKTQLYILSAISLICFLMSDITYLIMSTLITGGSIDWTNLRLYIQYYYFDNFFSSNIFGIVVIGLYIFYTIRNHDGSVTKNRTKFVYKRLM